jgi:cell volume regulation protein A
VSVAPPALLVAAVLMFVARPLAIMPLLLPFRFSLREQLLIAWGGLKGAVPIIVATFPLMFGHPDGRLLFNVVFFVVLISATLQGGTLPMLARALRLQQPEASTPAAAALEILALKQIDAEILDVAVGPGSPVAGRTVAQLHLPEGALVALVARGDTLLPPRGSTGVHVGDHLFVIARTDLRDAIAGALQISD